ncbi:MAG: potassium channel protein [Planctomycetota bacterium]
MDRPADTLKSTPSGPLHSVLRALLVRVDPAVFRLVVILLGVIAASTVGYMLIEGWDFWRSLYFTMITLTTVGYGDYDLSETGRRFTILVMIGGIGTASYAAGGLIQRTVSRGLNPEKRMLQRIKTMSDHYIVCGFGRMGQRVVRQLVAANAEFVVIDTDPKAVEQARELDMIALEGDATEDETLLAAGAERARGIAVLAMHDATNAMICLTARAICKDLAVVARAEDDSSVSKLMRAGATRVLSPSSHGADGIAQNLLRPEVARVLFGDGGVESALGFGEIEVTAASGIVNKTVREIGGGTPGIVFVASCAPGGAVSMRPDADRALAEGDVLIVAGTNAQIIELKRSLRLG